MRREDVGGTGDAGGKAAGIDLAVPEAPRIVAEAVVPLAPARRKTAKAITTGADVPGLGDHDGARQHRVLFDAREQRRIDVEAFVAAAHDRCQIEAEAIDPGAGDPAPHRIHGELDDGGAGQRQRIAAAGVVHQPATGVAVVQRIVQSAQGERGPEGVAFAGVIEHDIENDGDTRRMEPSDGVADFRQTARRQARIGRHEADRVVAPGIVEPERLQMALVDPGGERHQLDRVDTEFQQVFDDGGLGECRNRSALSLRHARMQFGEGPDLQFVDEAGRVPLALEGRETAFDHAFRHEMRCLDAALQQGRMMGEGPVEGRGIGIGQQFRGIETMAVRRVPRTIGAQAVAGAGGDARNKPVVHVAQAARQGKAIDFGIPRRVEDRDIDARRVARHHGDVGAIAAWRKPERGGMAVGFRQAADQVITVGAPRPVRLSIPAIDRDNATRSDSAVCVSMAWRAASGSKRSI